MKAFERLFPVWLLAGILLNFNGLLIEILEPDGALYATISKHIALTGDWINLWGDGHDWLDKPHLPFWLCAASFKVFGIHAFAYKLPAFLFWLAGIYFTYRLALILYNKYTAQVAAVLYVFALHGILNNFDVRAEPFLTTLSIGAIFYFYQCHLSGKWIHLIFAALLCAGAIMTKGIFVIITIGGGFILWWIISKQWRQFLNYRWYIMLVLILLFITPELYCLYMQFDAHPEKVIFGKTNVSGLRFFFWDSQFGRFFNTGPIKGSGDKTFFLHTTLWAYLPWSVLLYCAVIDLIRKRKHAYDINHNRWIIFGSAGITFLLFSLSGFQLPHYVTILFPQFSIITAVWLTSIKKDSTLRNLKWVQITLLILGTVTVSILSGYSKIGYSPVAFIIIALILLAACFYLKPNNLVSITAHGTALSFVLLIYLFNFFYPQLLSYQAGMVAGKWMRTNKPALPASVYHSVSYSFEFYAPGYIQNMTEQNEMNAFLKKNPHSIIFTPVTSLIDFQKNGYTINVLGSYPYFHISMLELPFLNPTTRQAQLEQMCLIEIGGK